MKPARSRLPLRRKLAYALVPTFGLLLLLELGARVAYFQARSERPLALPGAVETVRAWRNRATTARKVERLRAFKKSIAGADEALYGPEGREVLDQFAKEYESHFARLVAAVREDGASLAMLHLPSPEPGPPSAAAAFCRPFYRSLAEKHGVEFLDPSEELSARPLEETTLHPEDNHLSRAGARIVASFLAARLAGRADRSPRAFEDPDARCGDLEPGARRVWVLDPRMPFFVSVNRQGFRKTEDLEFPKRRTRVLFLGDSFTFGPYLDDHDTYPALLEKAAPSLETINAGLPGYTISDEVGLYEERARRAAPDIVVLQALDNDVFGLFWFQRNEFDRKKRRYEPTPAEAAFIEGVMARNARRPDAPESPAAPGAGVASRSGG